MVLISYTIICMRLIFATYNEAKLSQVQKLGQHMGIIVIGPRDTGVHFDMEETGQTFQDNAVQKLSQAQAALINNTEDWIAGDDSGLMIDALGGEPGVKTRRWAGHEMTDEELKNMILEKLAGVPPAERTAHLVTVVALGKVGQNPLIFEGRISGSILLEPDKDSPVVEGFPLSQLFYIPDIMKTYGQYLQAKPEERGDFLSQRDQAFTRAFKYINELSGVTGQFE